MKLKLYIADVDAEHVERMRQCAERNGHFEIVGTSGNGREALRQIQECQPQLLVTDVQLPGLDGIMLLKDLQIMKQPPVSIVCTRFYSDECVSRACRYGASYFMYKPLDYNRIAEILLECWASRQRARAAVPGAERDVSSDIGRINLVRDIIRELGIPARLSGCQYLIESILMLDDNMALLRNLSKGLYAEIAERMDATPGGVERSVRSAIATAYARGTLNKSFAHCPTNKEFIEYLHRRVCDAATGRSAPPEDCYHSPSCGG